jgi:hypothetical protein
MPASRPTVSSNSALLNGVASNDTALDGTMPNARGWAWRSAPDTLDQERELLRDTTNASATNASATNASATNASAAQADARPTVALPFTHAVLADDRETAYQSELLGMFRRRIYLVSGLALAIVPVFAVLHAILSPTARLQIGLTHAVLWILLCSVRLVARRVPNLHIARCLCLFTYVIYSFITSVIPAQAGADFRAQVIR